MKVELEIPDDGKLTDEILAKLPAPLKAHVDGISDKVFKEGFQKGMAKKADDLKPHLIDPAERERQAALAAELEERKLADLERDKKYDEARKIRDDQHAKELEKEKGQTARAIARVRASVRSEIQTAAVKAGARDESLDELAAILGGEIDLDDNLEPFVKGKDGKPAVNDKNEAVTIEGRVRAYLDSHKHHIRVNNGKGGGAPGGASFAHLTGSALVAAQKLAAVEERIAKEGATDTLVAEQFEAMRAMRAAQAGS